jgi:hypothetical protein
VGDAAATDPPLGTTPSSSSSSSSRASEKLSGSGFPFASMPVPRPVLEPSSWASSSSAAVRIWERCGVWAAEEEERLAAACVCAESAWGVRVGSACVHMACTQCNARSKGRGEA